MSQPQRPPLTPARKRVLDALRRLTRKRGMPPSYEELAKATGVASLSTVCKHLRLLERDGYIRQNGIYRAWEIADDGFARCAAGHAEVWYRAAACPACAALQLPSAIRWGII